MSPYFACAGLQSALRDSSSSFIATTTESLLAENLSTSMNPSPRKILKMQEKHEAQIPRSAAHSWNDRLLTDRIVGSGVLIIFLAFSIVKKCFNLELHPVEFKFGGTILVELMAGLAQLFGQRRSSCSAVENT